MLHNLNQDVLHIFFNLRDHYTSAFFVESVNSKVFEYAHAFTHLIFSLSIIACFIFNNLPFRQASIACVALARSHKPKFLVIPLVYKNLNSLVSKFSKFLYMGGVKRVKQDILLTFYGTAVVSRTLF